MVGEIRKQHIIIDVALCDHWKTNEPICELAISYGDKHPKNPKYQKGRYVEIGDEVITVVSASTPAEAITDAACAALRGNDGGVFLWFCTPHQRALGRGRYCRHSHSLLNVSPTLVI